ncbi:hypothetical protein BGZ60DRAFT_515044 [Tricladium varicosporioides]|nr:hypothetical protein BGZ60DRAFT_515044 [Hymenoscyphus varicosporioides]
MYLKSVLVLCSRLLVDSPSTPIDHPFFPSSSLTSPRLISFPAGTASDTDSNSPLEDVDNNTDGDDDDLFGGEVRHPPEYCIAKSESLDIGRLRQKRYSPKTQDALAWVKEHRTVPSSDDSLPSAFKN